MEIRKAIINPTIKLTDSAILRQKNAIAEIGKYQFRFRFALISASSRTGKLSCSILPDHDIIQQDRTYIAYKPAMLPTVPTMINSTGRVVPNVSAN